MRIQTFILYDYIYIYNYIFIANFTNILFRCYILNRKLLIAYYQKTIQKIIPQIIVKKQLNFTTDNTLNIQNLYIVIQEKSIDYICFETINNPNKSINS